MKKCKIKKKKINDKNWIRWFSWYPLIGYSKTGTIYMLWFVDVLRKGYYNKNGAWTYKYKRIKRKRV